MTQKNDGGPAFPFVWFKSPDGMIGTNCTEGMTLLDFFAASVRQSMGTWTPHVPAFDSNDQPIINRTMGELLEAERRARAEWCYAEARAMLAAREAKS